MDFINRLHNAWKIFTLSLDFVRRDKSLMIVPTLMMLSGIAFCVLALIGFILSEALAQEYIYIGGLSFLLFAQLWSTFLGAMQSWMVHEVAHGKDTTLASGFKRAIANLKDILAYAVVFMVVSLLLGSLRNKGKVGQVAAGFLDAIAGIVGKLVLPAMIVTERSFVDAVKQLKDATHALPEIAAYEIGIGPLTTLAIFAGILLTAVFALSLGAIVAIVFAVVFIIALILLSTFVNNTYYTLLYMTLIEKKKIKGLDLKF